MKKYVVVLMIGIVIGMVLYKKRGSLPFYQYYNQYFNPNTSVILTSYKKNIMVAKYSVGNPLFIDRSYYDQIGDKRLEGLFLVQIARHYQGMIAIQAERPLVIYRIISESNENSIFDEYEKTDIKVKVVGGSSEHTKVVKKKFPAGPISLAAGGPVASSPILISVAEPLPELGFRVLPNKNSMN